MFFVKRITVVLSVLASAGILIMGCEKMDGPPPYLSKHLENNQLLLISRADGATPLTEAIPLDSLDKVTMTDSALQVFEKLTVKDSIGAIIKNSAGQDSVTVQGVELPINAIGKIIFR